VVVLQQMGTSRGKLHAVPRSAGSLRQVSDATSASSRRRRTVAADKPERDVGVESRGMDRLHTLSLGAAIALALAIALPASAARAAKSQAPDASDIAEGLRLYQQKGNCNACHGWAGDGRGRQSEMPEGPNLRETKIPRAGLIMTIKCGRLNSQMPAFDKFAYSDGRCYGKTQADLKQYPTRMPDPPATLQPREIELITDFLLAKIVGKGPMDRAKCVDFWGTDVDACRELPR
jgi:mono/diheme cytochrome c family protein